MAECNSIERDVHETPNMYPNLSTTPSNDQQLRLNKINEIKDYFITEIKERELMSKNLRVAFALKTAEKCNGKVQR